MPTTYTRLLNVAETSALAKAPALTSVSLGGSIQTRNLGNGKRSWTERYVSAKRTSTINNWIAQLYTWMNTGTELDVTEMFTGTSSVVSCVITQVEDPIALPFPGSPLVTGLSVTFRET